VPSSAFDVARLLGVGKVGMASVTQPSNELGDSFGTMRVGRDMQSKQSRMIEVCPPPDYARALKPAQPIYHSTNKYCIHSETVSEHTSRMSWRKIRAASS
jgi:hypothetical protein